MINLKVERAKKNMTQEELGKKAGVVRQTISNIETGKQRPSIDVAQAIAKALGFDWTRFFPSK